MTITVGSTYQVTKMSFIPDAVCGIGISSVSIATMLVVAAPPPCSELFSAQAVFLHHRFGQATKLSWRTPVSPKKSNYKYAPGIRSGCCYHLLLEVHVVSSKALVFVDVVLLLPLIMMVLSKNVAWAYSHLKDFVALFH